MCNRDATGFEGAAGNDRCCDVRHMGIPKRRDESPYLFHIYLGTASVEVVSCSSADCNF